MALYVIISNRDSGVEHPAYNVCVFNNPITKEYFCVIKYRKHKTFY